MIPSTRRKRTNEAAGSSPHWLKSIWSAFANSFSGLKIAFQDEDSVKREVIIAIVLIPLALALPVSPAEKALLIATVLLVFIVELLNTAIEACVDMLSTESHPLAKKAKDIGSAAVLLALVLLATVWGFCLFPLFRSWLT